MGEFDRFDALSFDCYGTLIDWETGIASALFSWAARCGLAAEELLGEFASVETLVQQEHPGDLYPQILRRVMREVGERRECPVTPAETERFAASVGDWPAFADAPAALRTLKDRFKLVILSNVDLESFSRSNERLGVEFDRVLTAEEIGSYKPDPRNFAALIGAMGALGVEASRLLHVAQSLYHDHGPAAASGLATVWIDRRGDKPGYGATPPPEHDVAPDWIFPSLGAFAAAALGDPIR